MSYIIPTVGRKEQDPNDIVSKLQDNRIIFLEDEVRDDNCNLVVKQLMYLDSINSDPIRLYINSPGGSVHAGLAVYDAMRLIKSEVHTVVLGLAASMGYFLASSGTKGHRYAGKYSQLMAHEVSSGTRGRVSDQITSLEHSKHLNRLLTQIIADNCGQKYEDLLVLFRDDVWQTAEQAKEFGAIDEII